MKKLLFAVLLLCPAFAAAEPASLANRPNVQLNISKMEPKGDFKMIADKMDWDADVSVGLTGGYNLADILELGLAIQSFGSYEEDEVILGDKWESDTSLYSLGLYAKVLAPQFQLSSDTGLSIYGKIGVGQYYIDNNIKRNHVTVAESYDHTGISFGGGADINFPNWMVGLEYQLHRVDYETMVQNIGVNVGYRF